VVTPRPVPAPIQRRASLATEWILLTSGTTGTPKLVVHTLQSLGGALPTQTLSGRKSIWSTFYDIRRYGGLQIYLRAVLSGSPLVLSSSGEPTPDFLARAAAARVTHISGTPSHWRRALMSGQAAILKPEYVRLSGEVADQSVLDNLRAVYPNARIAHAFASTEAGVAFDVNDGLAGFPAAFVDVPTGEIELKVVDHTLRIRSGRNAARYLGAAPGVLVSDDGYVDTGDMVELADGRYYFRGRVGGVINRRRSQGVSRGGRVGAERRSPGAHVPGPRPAQSHHRRRGGRRRGSGKSGRAGRTGCRQERSARCLPPQPRGTQGTAMLRFVPALEFTPAGKLVRPKRVMCSAPLKVQSGATANQMRTPPAEIAAYNAASRAT